MKQEVVLDVRTMHPRERHPKIFQEWDALPVGGTLRLINDHDPKPLYYEFLAERKGEANWNYLERGPEQWVVDIRRIYAPDAGQEGAPQAEETGCRPAWAKDPAAQVVDVRDDLRRGEEPFSKILSAAQGLGENEIFLVRAIFEPRPLYAVLGSRGFEHWTERAGEEDWKVYFLKKGPAGAGGNGGRQPGGSPCGGASVQKLDVRGLEPPEPMVRILSKLPELGAEDTLEVTHFREPVHLYPHLEEAGFGWRIEKLAETLYKLTIRRKR